MNVNSLKVRLPQELQWLVAREPALLCQQEAKVSLVAELAA
jgi:exonuclease III